MTAISAAMPTRRDPGGLTLPSNVVPFSFYRSIRATRRLPATPPLPASNRTPADKLQANQPSIPTNPLSYKDAAPILKALGGDESPREWQGALPFTYHLGAVGNKTDSKTNAGTNNGDSTKVTVHMHLEQDIALRTIWDVIGTIPG